jgi:hypothetical protein
METVHFDSEGLLSSTVAGKSTVDGLFLSSNVEQGLATVCMKQSKDYYVSNLPRITRPNITE